MYIDIHTHNSKSNGKYILNVFPIDLYSLSINEKHVSSGIHPWFIDVNEYIKQLNDIEEFIINNRIIAIGECGLDKNRSSVDFAFQNMIFEKQLILAEKYNLPVIIHCVKSYNEIIDFQKKYNVPFIYHGFNSSIEIVQKIISLNGYIGIGDNLINNPEKLKSIFQVENFKNNFFCETDDSDIDISETYLKLSKILAMPTKKIIELTNNNFKKIFN